MHKQTTQTHTHTHTHTHLPGVHRKLGVEHAGRYAELLEEELETVAALHSTHEQQRLPAHQPQFEERVDEQELVLLVAVHAVLRQL